MSCTICGKEIETVYTSEYYSGDFCKDCWEKVEHAFDTKCLPPDEEFSKKLEEQLCEDAIHAYLWLKQQKKEKRNE